MKCTKAHQLLEEMVANNYLWLSKRLLQKKAMEVYKLDAIIALTSKVATLIKQSGSMKVSVILASPLSYKDCGYPHFIVSCQITSPFKAPSSPKQAHFVSKFN